MIIRESSIIWLSDWNLKRQGTCFLFTSQQHSKHLFLNDYHSKSQKIGQKTTKKCTFVFKQNNSVALVHNNIPVFKVPLKSIILNSEQTAVTAIETIEEFVESLKEGERTTFGALLKAANLRPQQFSKYAIFSDNCYTRNCIAHNEKFELMLLCWYPKQATPIHDHGGEECWVKIIEGEFSETIYQETSDGKLKPVSKTNAHPGDITYMIDFMGYHNLKNESNKQSLSLHLYAKPIGSCNVFNEETQSFYRKQLAYDNEF